MTEEIKKIVRKYFETVWNEGDPSAVDEILAEGYVAHIANISSAIRGVEQFKQFITLFRALSPNLNFVVEDQLAEGDKVATRWTARNWGSGGSLPLSSTGDEIAVTGITIHKVADGRLTESWDNWDAITAFQAMGQDAMETLMLDL